MKTKLLLFLFVFLSFNTLALAQGQNEQNMIEDSINTDDDVAKENDMEEEEIDAESQILEAKDYALQQIVSMSQTNLDYIDTLEAKDSLVYNFCILRGQSAVISYDKSSLEKTKLDKAFTIVLFPQNQKVFSVSEMVINENGAWDFIYQRVFDSIGNLKVFVRKYNTFNSGCSEVAFETSKYFFNNGVQIAKTYQIVDQNGKDLDINNCEMAREDYTIEKTLIELTNKYSFSFENVSTTLQLNQQTPEDNNTDNTEDTEE